jgi:hypothetical protein
VVVGVVLLTRQLTLVVALAKKLVVAQLEIPVAILAEIPVVIQMVVLVVHSFLLIRGPALEDQTIRMLEIFPTLLIFPQVLAPQMFKLH